MIEKNAVEGLEGYFQFLGKWSSWKCFARMISLWIKGALNDRNQRVSSLRNCFIVSARVVFNFEYSALKPELNRSYDYSKNNAGKWRQTLENLIDWLVKEVARVCWPITEQNRCKFGLVSELDWNCSVRYIVATFCSSRCGFSSVLTGMYPALQTKLNPGIVRLRISDQKLVPCYQDFL